MPLPTPPRGYTYGMLNGKIQIVPSEDAIDNLGAPGNPLTQRDYEDFLHSAGELTPSEIKAQSARRTGAPRVGRDRVDTRTLSADVGSYDDFQSAFRKTFNRDITQDELNDNGFLSQLGNNLVRQLPADRLAGFSSARLGQLDNNDLKRVIDYNPQVLGDFSADRLATFSKNDIQQFTEHLDRLSPGNQLSADLRGVLGSPSGGLPPTPDVRPSGGSLTTRPGAAQYPPRPIGGDYQIRPPQLPGGVTSRNPLDLYMQLLGLTGPEGLQGGPRSFRTPGRSDSPSFRTQEGPPGGYGPPAPPDSPANDINFQNIRDPRTGNIIAVGQPGLVPGLPGQVINLPTQKTPEEIALINAQIRKIDADIAREGSSGSNRLPPELRAELEREKLALERELGTGRLDIERGQLDLAQRQADLQNELGQGRLDLESGQLSGYLGGSPTLERERAAAQQDLANMQAAMQAASQAAQVALAQGNFEEAQRQNRIAEGLQRDQFNLQAELGRGAAERANTELGYRGREIEAQIGNLGLQGELARRRFGEVDLPESVLRRQLEGRRFSEIDLPGAQQRRQLELSQLFASPGGRLAYQAATGNPQNFNIDPNLVSPELRGVLTGSEPPASSGPTYTGQPVNAGGFASDLPPKQSTLGAFVPIPPSAASPRQPVGYNVQTPPTPEVQSVNLGTPAVGTTTKQTLGLLPAESVNNKQALLSSSPEVESAQQLSNSGVPSGFRPLSPRTQRKLLPSQVQELGTAVNVSGGRSPDYFAQSERYGRTVGRPLDTTYKPAVPNYR